MDIEVLRHLILKLSILYQKEYKIRNKIKDLVFLWYDVDDYKDQDDFMMLLVEG